MRTGFFVRVSTRVKMYRTTYKKTKVVRPKAASRVVEGRYLKELIMTL